MRVIQIDGTAEKFEEWGALHGLELVCTERPLRNLVGVPRYYARFAPNGTDFTVEIIDGCCLASLTGDGPTPQAAAADYRKRLAGQRIVLYPTDPRARREIQCPNEWSD